MYLFTRSLRFAGGHAADSMAWAVAMVERVNAGTELEVALFQRVFSPGLGTVSFATFVNDLEALQTANDTLTGDADYLAAVDRGAAFTDGTGVDDGVIQLVHGEPDPTRDVTYVSTVRTVVANGMIARGVELGVQIAQHAEKVTGVPTLFGVSMTGAYGGVGWITGYERVRQYEEAQATLMADPEWLGLLDRDAAAAYSDSPTASEQLVWRRVV